jgi:hypothetical protein
MGKQIRNLNYGIGCGGTVFVIGRTLKGHIDNDNQKVFGTNSEGFFSRCMEYANQALRFYNFQLRSYRKAVDMWALVGLRNSIVKDIRKMIGKMIWKAREEAEYEFFRQ